MAHSIAQHGIYASSLRSSAYGTFASALLWQTSPIPCRYTKCPSPFLGAATLRGVAVEILGYLSYSNPERCPQNSNQQWLQNGVNTRWRDSLRAPPQKTFYTAFSILKIMCVIFMVSEKWK